MRVQELTKQYDGKTVVDGVSFAIPKGKVISLIGPNGVVRTILYYPLSTCRNFDEIKRIILALQKADADACATPADWRPGDDVIVPTAGSCGVAKERMDNQSENQYCLDWFMCFRKESK